KQEKISTESTSNDDKQAEDELSAMIAEEEAKEAEELAELEQEEAAENEEDKKVITLTGGITVKELAEKIEMRPNLLVAELMKMNIFASINQRLDMTVIRQVAAAHDFEVEQEKRTDNAPSNAKQSEDLAEIIDQPEDLLPRPPVVTFLGHVDHGKTSLMDKIRNATVADGEHGGITQHVAAYTVELNGNKITFLDTPGHAAFTSMRARGANLTDIAVIIIAADDGIMPQTKEAIMHAQAAEDVAMMIAINKIDLPGANVDRVMQQLQEMGLTPEEWGGELICCPVSAMTGEGIEHLLEMMLMQADIMELSANPTRLAKGFIIEGSLEQGMGPIADLLITSGTLKIGDPILCGSQWGRVKALISDHGTKLKSVGPATPVRCLGLSGVPEAGAAFKACINAKWAKTQAAETKQLENTASLSVTQKVSLDSVFEQMESDQQVKLKVLIKADTQGSIEAIIHSLQEIKSDKISISFILTGTGNITVNDVMLASASNAVILGFHVAKESGVDSSAKHEGIEIRLHHVIYELIDQVRDAMLGLLSHETKEDIVAHADVKEVYPIGKLGKIAGCMITKGVVNVKNKIRVKRGDEVLFEGTMSSLKHFQDEAKELREAQECGIRINKFADFDVGDIFEFYEVRQLEKTL
ncbi:MAG: translation initiation factor IF-2, partial [Kiritimatiellae bacterium]|nr:translation initiation factor IF-2 [Kiritimatiellia bacterium]